MKGGKLQIILHLARGKLWFGYIPIFWTCVVFFPVGEHTFQECV